MDELMIFALFDAKAECFLPPFVAPNEAMATRWLVSSLRDPDNDVAKFPEDYTLFYLGIWRPKQGEFMIEPGPRSVVRAQGLLKGDS